MEKEVETTPSDPRAAELVRRLGLLPHPEGGWYRETFRSSRAIRPGDGRPARSALTSILFLLADGGASRWHRVASDEAWHFHGGAPLELFRLDAEDADARPVRELLGPAGDADALPLRVVPAGEWQAARTTGAWTLVGCTVGPGFDFADFAMLADREDEAERLRPRLGELAALV